MGKSNKVKTPDIYVPESNSNTYVSPYDYTSRAPEPAPLVLPEMPSALVEQNTKAFDDAMNAVTHPTILNTDTMSDLEKKNTEVQQNRFSVNDTIVTSPLDDPINAKKLKAILG